MSGVEENKGANAAINGPPGDSPPDSPPIANGSDESPPDNPPNPNGLDQYPGANPYGEPATGNPQSADGSDEPAPGANPDGEPATGNPQNADGSDEPAPGNPPSAIGSDESAPGANPGGEPAPSNPQNADGSGEPAPGNPPNADGSDEPAPNPDGSGSGSSFEVIPDVNNDNVVTVTTRSSAPGRLETAKFRKKPLFMAGIEVGEDGFPVGPYISLAERMRLQELNNPPDPVRPRELSSSEEEIPRPPSDDDPNRIPEFPMDTP